MLQSKPFVIADVGSNWRTFNDCMSSITMAKKCGATAVKFQLFNEVALYGIRSLNKTMPSELPVDWLPKLKEKALACDIEFMCSAFSPALIDVIDPYVKIHKLASSELTHVRILEKLNKIGKPVFLSTGASGFEDIKMAIDILRDCKTVLMYCVSAYPAKEIYLETLALLKSAFSRPVGFSDHTTDVCVIPTRAYELGAEVIEKHFTIDPEINIIDRNHSLNFIQFKRMVEYLNGYRKNSISYTPEEITMLLRHNRRLIAIKDIKVGDIFEEDKNFGIYRSKQDDTHAFHPCLVNDVNGKLALKDIKIGDGIGPGDVKLPEKPFVIDE